MRALGAALVACAACGAPPAPGQGVTYRDGLEAGAPNSGERGTVKISEVLWSGSVRDGKWDPTDVFVELRNESSRPVNMSGWQIFQEGVRTATWKVPASEREVAVGEHVFVAAKSSGCFPDPDWVIPEMAFTYGEAFELTLLDADDRLMEPVGAVDSPPFSGGYDGVTSRSMERAELMFGAEGSFPHVWHYYTDAEVDEPNNLRIREECRAGTGASPGWGNSPDYSGAFANGNFE